MSLAQPPLPCQKWKETLTLNVNPVTGEVSIDYDAANDLSVEIMTLLGEQSMGVASAAIALTLGRLRYPKSTRMPADLELAFVEDVMGWSDTYLAIDPNTPRN